MVTANQEMVVYCFDTLVAHYNGDQPLPPSFEDGQHPLFVTWKKVVNGGEPRLRGCIGSLEPRGLVKGFRDYALTSALRDRRFPPIEAKELPLLECTVSILTNYETANDYLDWEVGKHGIIIEFSDPDYNTRRSATYLPEVAAHEGWTVIEAIDSLIRKAGCNSRITESLRKSIHLTRYQSTLFTMHFGEYVSYVKQTRDSLLVPDFSWKISCHHSNTASLGCDLNETRFLMIYTRKIFNSSLHTNILEARYT